MGTAAPDEGRPGQTLTGKDKVDATGLATGLIQLLVNGVLSHDARDDDRGRRGRSALGVQDRRMIGAGHGA
jgi:hypothetical protein